MLQSFPKPLSSKEEMHYLLLLEEGSEEARRILIERNLRLVAHIVKKYSLSEDTDDLISIGTIGLIKAIDSFDLQKGIRLATYASRCIDNELLMLLRSTKKQGREVYLYEPIGADKEGNEISLLDIMDAKEEDVVGRMELAENRKKLYYFMEHALDDREKQILSRRYGLYGNKEVTQREIAKELGISRSYVSRIEKKAISKLSDCFCHRKRSSVIS